MSIRKTGAATGHLTGVEGEAPGIAKEATATAWDGDDERALAEENRDDAGETTEPRRD